MGEQAASACKSNATEEVANALIEESSASSLLVCVFDVTFPLRVSPQYKLLKLLGGPSCIS